jgi:hypothetical protein
MQKRTIRIANLCHRFQGAPRHSGAGRPQVPAKVFFTTGVEMSVRGSSPLQRVGCAEPAFFNGLANSRNALF